MAEIDDLKVAATQTGATNPWTVCYLQLCQVAYCPPSQIPLQVRKVLTFTTGGAWKCVWGPALSADGANLCFAATYCLASGTPIVLAVVTRGTDLEVAGWAAIVQGWEDLFCFEQCPLPWDPSAPARVAAGSLDGLAEVQALTDGGQTVGQFVRQFVTDPANAGPIVAVTGHSLGGCLSTLMAPWLVTGPLAGIAPSTPVVPITFAAPTAGDAAFAAYYDGLLPFAQRVFNSLDVVPHAYGDLSSLDTIYQPCGIGVPWEVYFGVLGWEAAMVEQGVSYAQAGNNPLLLVGFCAAHADFFAEAAYQHHTTTYMSLLGGRSIGCTELTLTALLGRRFSAGGRAVASRPPLAGMVARVRERAQRDRRGET